jgi:hypothetical protein
MFGDGAGDDEIGKAVGRTISSIQQLRSRMGCTLYAKKEIYETEQPRCDAVDGPELLWEVAILLEYVGRMDLSKRVMRRLRDNTLDPWQRTPDDRAPYGVYPPSESVSRNSKFGRMLTKKMREMGLIRTPQEMTADDARLSMSLAHEGRRRKAAPYYEPLYALHDEDQGRERWS